jgi:hypothetical protein
MRLSNPNKKIKPTTKMETNKMKTILSTLSIALIAILPHAAQASTVTIAANGANVSGVGNSRFFTSSLTSQVLDLGDQIRVGFFSSSSLSAVVSNWNSGSYANLSALSTALNAIFTPIGETGVGRKVMFPICPAFFIF